MEDFKSLPHDLSHQILKEKKENPKYYMIIPHQLQDMVEKIYQTTDELVIKKTTKEMLMIFALSFPNTTPNIFFFLMSYILECDIDVIPDLMMTLPEASKATKSAFCHIFSDLNSYESDNFHEIYQKQINTSNIATNMTVCPHSCFVRTMKTLEAILHDQIGASTSVDNRNASFQSLKRLGELLSMKHLLFERTSKLPFLHLLFTYCGLKRNIILVENITEERSIFFVECLDVHECIEKALKAISAHLEWLNEASCENQVHSGKVKK